MELLAVHTHNEPTTPHLHVGGGALDFWTIAAMVAGALIVVTVVLLLSRSSRKQPEENQAD